MTLGQTIGFYLAVAGIGVSLTTIMMCCIALMHSSKRWFE